MPAALRSAFFARLFYYGKMMEAVRGADMASSAAMRAPLFRAAARCRCMLRVMRADAMMRADCALLLLC